MNTLTMLHFLLLLYLSLVFLHSPHVVAQDEKHDILKDIAKNVMKSSEKSQLLQATKHQHVSRFSPISPYVPHIVRPPPTITESSAIAQVIPPVPAPKASNARSRHKHHSHHHHHHHPGSSPSRSKVIHTLPPPPHRPLRFSPPPPSKQLPSPSPSSPPPLANRSLPPPALGRLPPPPPSRYANTPTPAPGFSVGASPHPPPPPPPLPSSPLPSSPPPSSPPPITSYPPPPKEDCDEIVCLPPLTKTPFMSPCGCVRPIEVKIDLSVPLYSLFPLISVLATNIAEATVLSPNQVEISGANADSQNPDTCIVDVNLVPLDQAFDNLTALLIFQKFWSHDLLLNSSLFGNYSVIYVHYPGLPSSPPSNSEVGAQGAPGSNGNLKQNPIGVNVPKQRHRMNIWIIAVIALTSAIGLVGCIGCFWILLLKFCRRPQDVKIPPPEAGLISARTKRSGGRSALSSDLGSSTSMSFSSSMATYTSTAKTFSLAEIERATDKFRPENVIGEGGFGRVYYGILDDGLKVAVKLLTRDEGGKEFIAEVEMLSRLHHRNLVKLIGICTEDHSRCLVYELIPNGSVESHLHGVDKETSPLDWKARMKIALGSARGLAYLHEDSNPRVIHRDFKASNILLENDFNPKVSDFGLAKAAPDEGRGHLSTRVMGTFGYVAPEYAMTGHLLVKSDVYSYGVVLLELLTGRKPVDMSQPPGQENLVTWARPLLTSKEGLGLLVDPSLGNNFPPDNLARVAAIASMCVQPEVSHRPFMGEVVQALKLVYNECDAAQTGTNGHSSNASQGGESYADSETRGGIEHPPHWLNKRSSQYIPDSTNSFISVDYDSGLSQPDECDVARPLSMSGTFPNSSLNGHDSSLLMSHSMSGPLRPSRSKRAAYNLRDASKRGSVSEHATMTVSRDRDFSQILS